MKQRKRKQRTEDQHVVVLEGIRSDFRIFDEELKDIRNLSIKTFNAVGKLQEDMNIIVKTDLEFIKMIT